MRLIEIELAIWATDGQQAEDGEGTYDGTDECANDPAVRVYPAHAPEPHGHTRIESPFTPTKVRQARRAGHIQAAGRFAAAQ